MTTNQLTVVRIREYKSARTLGFTKEFSVVLCDPATDRHYLCTVLRDDAAPQDDLAIGGRVVLAGSTDGRRLPDGPRRRLLRAAALTAVSEQFPKAHKKA